MIRIYGVAFALILSGCTAGGVAPTVGGTSGVASVTKIDVSLAAFPLQSTAVGPALGFSPEVTTVAVGSGVQFVNVDNTSHTSTSIPGASAFPATTPFSISATNASGTSLSSGWSSGTLPAGASSAVYLVDQPGTYLYGCFFHYSGNMRGMIVAH